MDSPKNLETNGSLQSNPLAELLVEIERNKLNGSLRLSNAEQKIIIYFDAGETVFAASNARQHRLFEMLLQAGKITKDELLTIENFTSDLALKENLLENNLLDKAAIDALFSQQISEILKTALGWRTGEWAFSPLVRVKGDVRFPVDVRGLLIEYARNLSAEEAARRFVNSTESFAVKSAMPAGVNLSPQESFVFSRFDAAALPIGEIRQLSGLPEAQTFQIIYALWLGGFLARPDWSAAFSPMTLAAISSAKLFVKKDETKPFVQPPTAAELTAEIEKAEEEAAPEEEKFTLEEYLDRTEKAKNLYEVFALAPASPFAEIKETYFSLAKRFHPDLYHKEADAKLLKRIQNGFTKLAHAYETLKHETSRSVYDFRMRKELAEIAEQRETGASDEAVDLQKQSDQAAANFEQGFNLVMDENYEAAVPSLARAVHFAPDNARYHAYFGKALSANKKHQHKAEAAFQTAVKLDAANVDYRIMLAEFFVSVGLLKRAEGELNRLLQVFPGNKEAQRLLDTLKKK